MLFHLEAVSGIHKSRKHFSGAVSERYSEYVMLFAAESETVHRKTKTVRNLHRNRDVRISHMHKTEKG